jgi:hypothetical protein
LAFALAALPHRSQSANQNILYYNNIWSDPPAPWKISPMRRRETPLASAIDRNLYWNNGAAIPQDSNELVNYTDDAHRLIANPLLGSQAGLIVPRWNPGANHFADGSVSIREAFEKLVGCTAHRLPPARS